MVAQVTPLALFAVVLLAMGAWTAQTVVERTSDRLLAGSMLTILETVSVEDDRVVVDVEPWSLALLDTPERDAVFYSVREGERLVTGYDELPILSDADTGPDPAFANLTVRGVRVRMAQRAILIPGRDEAVTVSVAQSLDSRRASLRELYRGLLILPGLLVVLAALLAWPALRWGLHSLHRLVESLARRSSVSATDFAPTPVELAPRELQPVLDAFNRLLASLERSTSGIQRFSADASHQLRTPLSVVSANLELLSDSKRSWSPEERRWLDDSRAAVSAMTRLVTQLLSTARADGAHPVGVADLGRSVRRVLSGLPTAVVTDVRVRYPATPVQVRGDEGLICEQLTNLIDNARKYGAPPVFIQIKETGDVACIRVWDHGSGVSESDLERLPKRFFRGSTSAEGSGLGLSIVEALAQAQGGSLTLGNRRSRSGLVARLDFQTAGDPEA
ncbi:MAG: sensor histidine kinase [Brevundimonas sp.]